jgi:hypothetical protein
LGDAIVPAKNEQRQWPKPNPQDVQDFTSYVSEMCGEFVNMAEAAQLPMLAYLLGMARDEANRLSSDAHKDEQTSRTG